MLVLWWLMYRAVTPTGQTPMGLVVLGLYTVLLPWLSIGTWNAIIGFLIMRFSTGPLAKLMPPAVAAAHSDQDRPITASTALLVCVRNENPALVIRNLSLTVDGLVLAGAASSFHLYILSDTNDPELAAHEELEFESFKAARSKQIGLTYRRRVINEGYKAGNVHDFCERWGNQHEFALTLDADSFMSGSAILRLVRMMQADPQLGILQGLVVAMPSQSGFTRLFQFGMRLGMRSWTMGSAWWQGDCGPYWGHNALFRIKPFTDHCKLPLLKPDRNGPRHILSHDQVEAVLMRRAGYHVRVMPLEDASWEQNPPTLPEFVQRDLRWCEGNMQYGELIALPKLALVSRIQLMLAMLMFAGAPAWIGLMLCAGITASMATQLSSTFNTELVQLLFVTTLVLFYLPKIASAVDVVCSKEQRAAFGGTGKFVSGVLIETVFSLLINPIMWFNQTVFLGRLLIGNSKGWIGQTRDDHSVAWLSAVRLYWLHTLFGLTCLILIAVNLPHAFVYALFFMLGLVVPIPLAVVLSWSSVGKWMTIAGIGQLPEETATPEDIRALELPALLTRKV